MSSLHQGQPDEGGRSEMPAPIDTAMLRAAFVQAQAQIMNNGTFEPVVVIAKPLALGLLDEIERLRAEVDRWKLMLTVPHAVVPESPEVKPFGEADIADHAYTWETENGHGFGEYRFETAGDPREFYDWGTGPIIRKRWVLIERTVLP